MKEIMKSSFYQLLIIYAIIVSLISFNLFWKYTIHLEILALILAALGISILPNQEKKSSKTNINKNIHYLILTLSILLIIILRFIPYANNSIPIGYDSGIYKYAIENGLKNYDSWVLGGIEPGFLYLMKPFSMVFSSQFLLTYFLIGLCVLLGVSIYLITKEYFNKETALIAILIYSLSSIQFLTFTYMYYKNIIALSFALLSIYFLKKEKYNYFILFGILTGITHRPTFYIYGLSYFIFTFSSPIKNKRYNLDLMKSNVINGAVIVIITSLFYLGKFRTAILSMFNPVLTGFVNPGQSPGTFIDFFTYQFSTLTYLPFALLGFFILARRKEFNMLFLWTLVSGVIVYFQFFFFNRFIIHLDIILIVLAAFGFSAIIENKKKIGYIVLILMLISSGFVLFNESINTKSLIAQTELETIEHLQNTPKDSYVMSTNKIYSPWILGYSDRKTIAPGLFDYNLHNKEEWEVFWTTKDLNEIKSFMNSYEKPLFVFIGQKQNDNLEKFSECFNLYYNQEKNKIFEYIC